MARFLLTVWPLKTHLHPFLAVADGLRKRGHEVGFYTGESARGTIGTDFRGVDFRFFPFRALDESAVRDAIGELIQSGLGLRQWTRFLLGSITQQLTDLNPILTEWKPDAILCDMAMWGPILVLYEARRIPTAVLSHLATCILPGPEQPFPGLSWLLDRIHPPPLRKAAAGVFQIAARRVRNQANKLRRTHGLAPLKESVTHYTGTLPLYLVPGIPEFDGARRDLPVSVRYIGPCLWDAGFEPPMRDDNIAGSKHRPRVLVTEGSIYRDQPVLLRAAAEGLADKPFDVILMAGFRRRPESLALGSLAPNIGLESWTPLSHALTGCDLVVTNCDSDTALTALAAGLPLVAAPMILDQPQVAMRVEASGAGIRLRKGTLTPDRLAAAVEQVLGDSRYRENARRLAARMEHQSGAAKAAELLEGLVASR